MYCEEIQINAEDVIMYAIMNTLLYIKHIWLITEIGCSKILEFVNKTDNKLT